MLGTNLVVLTEATDQAVMEYALRNVVDIPHLRVISTLHIRDLKLKLDI